MSKKIVHEKETLNPLTWKDIFKECYLNKDKDSKKYVSLDDVKGYLQIMTKNKNIDVDELWNKEVPELIREFQAFRKAYTSSCNSIRLDEVAQFILFKQGKLGIN